MFSQQQEHASATDEESHAPQQLPAAAQQQAGGGGPPLNYLAVALQQAQNQAPNPDDVVRRERQSLAAYLASCKAKSDAESAASTATAVQTTPLDHTPQSAELLRVLAACGFNAPEFDEPHRVATLEALIEECRAHPEMVAPDVLAGLTENAFKAFAIVSGECRRQVRQQQLKALIAAGTFTGRPEPVNAQNTPLLEPYEAGMSTDKLLQRLLRFVHIVMLYFYLESKIVERAEFKALLRSLGRREFSVEDLKRVTSDRLAKAKQPPATDHERQVLL